MQPTTKQWVLLRPNFMVSSILSRLTDTKNTGVGMVFGVVGPTRKDGRMALHMFLTTTPTRSA